MASIRSRALRLFGMVSLAVLLAANANVSGAAEISVAQSDLADGIIIKYKSEQTGARLDARVVVAANAARGRGFDLRYGRRGALGIHVLKLDRTQRIADVEALARSIQASDPNVEYAEADAIMLPTFTPNDQFYAYQWDFFNSTVGVNVTPAWDVATGTGVVVAVIDTGYRPHADLAANLLPGYDFISSSSSAGDGNGRDSDAQDPQNFYCSDTGRYTNWHGTHVAGTVAAVTNNGTGVAGIAFGAKVLPVRVLGKCGGSLSDIADGIVWASGGVVSGVPYNTNPARVLSLSLGGSGSCGSTYQNAINSARARQSVVIVAAGNDSQNASNTRPANCFGVIAVASTDASGSRSSFSNYGALVDIAAPGSSIYSTHNAGTQYPGGDSYALMSGTSMATPHVSGVAALVLSRNKWLSSEEVASLLVSTAHAFPGSCSQCGSGIVDAYAAVNAVYVPPAEILQDNLAFYGSTNGWETWMAYGYHPGMGMGSLSPNVTSDGRTINAFFSFEEYAPDGGGGWYISNQYTTLNVSGFPGNPGREWLVSVSGPGGASLLSQDAAFECIGGQCTWTWPLSYRPEGPATMTIVHH